MYDIDEINFVRTIRRTKKVLDKVLKDLNEARGLSAISDGKSLPIILKLRMEGKIPHGLGISARVLHNYFELKEGEPKYKDPGYEEEWLLKDMKIVMQAYKVIEEYERTSVS